MTEAAHIPVLLPEVLQALAVKPGDVIVDATFGAGGYSAALLAQGARVIAFDRDPDAIANGGERFAAAGDKLTLIEARFSDMTDGLRARGIGQVDGVVFDFGVSSMQLDEAGRGFSFRFDGPLDMRMSQAGVSAADLVNSLDESRLADILFRYGEEKRSRAVARMIVARRAETPFTRTSDLAEAVARITAKPGPQRIHPATRTFQALRIAVNGELDEVALGLAAAETVLAPGGRLAAVTFHSLEDRIVKRFLSERAIAANPSRHAPAVESVPASFVLIGRGAVEPGDSETDANPRARSAKLRAAKRTAAAGHPLDLASLGVWSFEPRQRDGRRKP